MVIFLLPNSHIKVAQLRLVICSQMIYNSIITKTHRISVKIFLDKSENDAKIVNRTNVCYEEEKQMNKDEINALLNLLTDEEFNDVYTYLQQIANTPRPSVAPLQEACQEVR